MHLPFSLAVTEQRQLVRIQYCQSYLPHEVRSRDTPQARCSVTGERGSLLFLKQLT